MLIFSSQVGPTIVTVGLIENPLWSTHEMRGNQLDTGKHCDRGALAPPCPRMHGLTTVVLFVHVADASRETTVSLASDRRQGETEPEAKRQRLSWQYESSSIRPRDVSLPRGYHVARVCHVAQGYIITAFI